MKLTWPDRFAPARSDETWFAHARRDESARRAAPLRQAIVRSRAWLLGRQRADGSWVGEVEGDSNHDSETVLLLAYRGEEDGEMAGKLARRLIDQQQHHGGWALYPGGPLDLDSSVKSYFALKLTGRDPSDETMQRARAAILAAGGAEGIDIETRFLLTLLGQISYEDCPEIPPEILWLPKWFPEHFAPLSIVSALRPVRELSAERGIRELFLSPPHQWRTGSWIRRVLDRALKFCRRQNLLPFRERAIAAAEQSIVKNDANDVWRSIALDCLGSDHDELQQTLGAERSSSPTRDTPLAVRALTASGISGDASRIGRAVDWLHANLASETNPHAAASMLLALQSRCSLREPNVLFAERTTTIEPDDSIAERTTTIGELPPTLSLFDGDDDAWMTEQEEAEIGQPPTAAAQSTIDRLLATQNRDGGWGAPECSASTPDVTARVLEALAAWEHETGHPAVDRAVAYLRSAQQADGSWLGRWGVNYIYGTWKVVAGLVAVGVSTGDPAVEAGAAWLLAHQHTSGGWGESPDSYADSAARGQGIPTASQTAWALLGLMAAGRTDHPAVERGVRFLVDMQDEDGGWHDAEFTGCGVSPSRYVRRPSDAVCFPLLALSQWAAGSGRLSPQPAAIEPRVVIQHRFAVVGA